MEFIDKNRKWFGLGSCIIILIGLFLPFAKVSAYGFSASVSMIEGLDGKLLIAPIGAAIGLFISKREKFSLIPLGITLAVILIDLLGAKSKVSNSIYSSSIEITIMVGTYIMILGIIIAAVFALLPGSKKDNASQVTAEPAVATQPVAPVEQANVAPAAQPVVQPTGVQGVQPGVAPVEQQTVVQNVQPAMAQNTQPVVQPVVEPTAPVQPTQTVENQPVQTPVDNNQQNVQ